MSGGMFGGKPAGQTQSTTNNTPWAGQQPYLSQGMSDAYNWLSGGSLGNGSGNPWSGPGGQIAPPTNLTPNGIASWMAQNQNAGEINAAARGPGNYGGSFSAPEQNAQQAIIDMARSGANGMYPASAQSLTNFMNGSMLNSNPYLDKMANAADNSIVRNYQTAVAPGVDSSMERFGRYGSGALDNAQSQSRQDLATQLGNVNAGIYGNAYQQGQQNMLQANAIAPQTANLGLGLQQAQSAVGQQQRLLPLQRLQDYMGLIQGNYGGTSTQSQPYFNNPMGNAMGGALAGFAMGGPVGGAIGGGLGLLSDRRFKESVKKIGKTDGGLNVYTYRYKGRPEMHMGVMADEAKLQNPDAVQRINGIDYVNYSEVR